MEALLIGSAIGVIAGIIVTILVKFILNQINRGKKISAASSEADRILSDAEEQKKRLLLEAQEEALRNKQEIASDARDR